MEPAVQLFVYALIAFDSAFPGSSAQQTSSNTAGVPSQKWYTETTYPETATTPYRTTAWPYRTTAWPYRTTAWPYRTTAWPYRTTAWPYRTTTWPITTFVPCGGQLTGERGAFTSPNYPYSYPHNARCVWYITVDRHSQIYLTLTNVQLECGYDYVRVYNGPSTSSPQIGQVCQSQGVTFSSSSNTMTVVFTSDGSITGSGFTASYYYYDTASCAGLCGGSNALCSCDSSCVYSNSCCRDFCDVCPYENYNYCFHTSTPSYPNPTTPATGSCYGSCYGYAGNCSCSSNCAYYGNCCDDFCNYCPYLNYGYCQPSTTPTPSTPGSCGGYLGGPYGSFSSPNYPYNYPNGAYCTWHIQVERNDKIYLTFLKIQMEACSNCNCDSISIYDGPSTNYRRIGFICRNNTTVFESSSNTMTVVFRTDGSVTATGFYAHYNTVHQNRANIQCSSDYMEVTLQRSYIESLGYNASELYLNDPNCRPQTTGSQVLFRIPLNRCGTFREVNNGSIAYYNNIRGYSSGGVITRQTNLQLRVGCKMEQNTNVEIMYVAKEEVTANETSWGQYRVNMAFYTSNSFWTPVREWPYYVDLNQELFVQVQLNSSDSDLVVFVDTCVASPSSHDFVSKTYYLIRNGCVRDGTYSSYYSNAIGTARFKFSAFKFLQSHPSVYLQCKIAVCQAYDYSARCYRGCLPRSKRDLSSSGRKTEVVLGPIQLRQEGAPGDQMKAGEKAPVKIPT
ncbi:deleted in malignant brain tumors 1 protein-like [Polyodon spathula]|uniref:deleted in malignant brain tumors 1 protein-like n=1 Tax=Polyodon spathula TaxID=7913 RepID=UPI001B7E3C25|nr:deleted in malignant brain tumors 1 protein-like [Polyodon spathula]